MNKEIKIKYEKQKKLIIEKLLLLNGKSLCEIKYDESEFELQIFSLQSHDTCNNIFKAATAAKRRQSEK